jgi:hypothetical protein
MILLYALLAGLAVALLIWVTIIAWRESVGQ